jgi:hypothetical protein
MIVRACATWRSRIVGHIPKKIFLEHQVPVLSSA